MEYRGGAHDPQGAAPRVPDDGIGHVPAATSCQPRAVGEVDVFVDHEEIFVEAAQPFEQFVLNRKGGATDTKHFTRSHEPSGMGAVAVFESAARAQIAVTSAVDDVRTVEKHDP